MEELSKTLENITLQKKKIPTYVSLQLSADTTVELVSIAKELLLAQGSQHVYPVCRGSQDVAHITLAFNNDFSSREEYEAFISTNYEQELNKEFTFRVVAFYADKHCVACNITLKDEIKSFPEARNLHVTLMLNGKKPVYSNILIERLNNTLDNDEYVIEPPVNLEFKATLLYSKACLRHINKEVV